MIVGGVPKSVKPHTGVKGMDIILRKLNNEIQAIHKRTMGGLIEGAIIIREDMDKTPPLIPVDTNNLRSSWFTTGFRNEKLFGLIIGFNANYAIFVHEMVDKDKKINWNRPGSGPKFFEASLKRNIDEVLKAIYNNGRIKK